MAAVPAPTLVRVETPTAPYDVAIGHGVVDRIGQLVAGANRVAVVHPGLLHDQLSVITSQLSADVEVLLLDVPDGESAKQADVLVSCWERLGEAGFTRNDMIIGYGGGATTDLAGFVAASWLRGVGLVTVPTTVLGMVDAAVGGKTGINTRAGKNLVGAFHEPRGVLCDLSVLASLPRVEVVAGLAEVIKCGFIADPEVLTLVESDPAAATRWDSPALAELITRGIRVKAQVVAGDLTEATSVGADVGRELLNYGHTFGHAVEAHEHFGIRHGEVVAIGMVYVAELAHRLGMIDAGLLARHRSVLESVGLPTNYRGGQWDALRAIMAKDKKSRGSTLRFAALTGLAQAEMLVGPPEDVLRAAYEAISS
ncbi:3-dehydroquinate synthase [Propionibacteriaceae bacterium Y2011]